MKKKILIIAMMGIVAALGGSCCKEEDQDQEQANTPPWESKQSPQGIEIVINFDTVTKTDTIDLD